MMAATFAIISVPAGAAPLTDVWDGTADTSWYSNLKNEFTLTTAEQLAGLAKLVNEAAKNGAGKSDKLFYGVTIKLGADIILNEGTFTLADDKKTPLYNGAAVTDAVKEWTPIGEASNDHNTANVEEKNVFWGSFDGQGHTISGIYINQPDTQQMGFFSKFAGSYLANVKIANSYICGDSRTGSLVGFVANGNATNDFNDIIDTVIENVSSSAIVVAEASNKDIRSGGMFGMFRQCGNVIVNNVDFEGTISGFGGNGRDNAMLIGGLAGTICVEDAEERYTFSNCDVYAAIYLNNTLKETNSGERRTGGLIGSTFRFYGSFINCSVNILDTNITEENGFTDANRVASLVGYYENLGDYTFEECSFNHIGAFKRGLGGASTPDTCIINGHPFSWWEELVYGDIPGATNHSPGEYTPAVPHSCTENGTVSYAVCSMCNAVVDKDCTTLETIVDPARCDDLGVLIFGMPPTHTSQGTIDHYECQICGKFYDADKNEVESIIIEKLTTSAVSQTEPENPEEDKITIDCNSTSAFASLFALIATSAAIVIVKKKH